MKKRKHKIAEAAIMLMLAAGMVSGCGKSMHTEEQIVVPKDDQGGDDSGSLEESGTGEATSGMISGEIAEQVQAPERYQSEFEEGIVRVKVDAPVILPHASGFKLYQVTGRIFTQEDYDNVNQVLLNGGRLWDRDYEAMEKSNGFIRKEIEERIAQLKGQQAGNGESKIAAAREKTYEELISEWEERLKEAPEEPVIVEVPAVVSYSADAEDIEENYLSGYVTVNSKDYSIMLDNNLRDDWRWVQFEVRGPQNKGSYIQTGQDEGEKSHSSISTEQIKEDAQILMEALGFDEFVVSGEEHVNTYAWDELTNEDILLDTGYKIHFTRELDGIPVTYTHESGTTTEEDNSSWPYETIDLVYNEEGLQDFLWVNPYELKEEGSEYVFLLPFSDIQNVFEKMIVKKHSDWYQDDLVNICYEINEVRLGYMRIREKGNAKEGTMIPVWDFFGSETIVYNDMDEVSVLAMPYESMLTINAMDGTVIDRGLGY